MLAGAASGASAQEARVIGAPVVLAHERSFHIGAAQFSPATREVIFDGQRSIIEPRVMQMLVALHDADGAVVAKDDLAILCWEGRIVGEDAINRVVSRLRAVAEKQAGGQFRVETITKVGYRLIPADPNTDGTSAEATDDIGVRIGRRELVAGGTALAAAAAAGVGWTLAQRDRMPAQARMLVDDSRKALREGNLDSPYNAVGALREATQHAPDSAEAWGLLSYAYMIQASAADSREGPGLYARATAAMKRAFALEPYQADALTARLRMIPKYRNWYNYEQACRAALRRRPHHPELMGHLAGLLRGVGRIREALPLHQSALRQMPRSAILLAAKVDDLWSLGLLEEADAALTEAFQLLPRSIDVWATKVEYLMYTGRPQEAAAMLADKENLPLGIEDDSNVGGMMVDALVSGSPALIRQAIENGDSVARSGKGSVIVTALFASFVGDTDEFFRLVNALYFNRGFTMPSEYFTRSNAPFVGHNPDTSFLFTRVVARARRDLRFAQLTRELGLDDYWARTNSRSKVIA